jgi:hypothetical protein
MLFFLVIFYLYTVLYRYINVFLSFLILFHINLFCNFTEKNTEKYMGKLRQTLVDLNYYKGNIVIQCNYNGKVFRYNAFKVHEKYFDKRTKSLKPCDGLF